LLRRIGDMTPLSTVKEHMKKVSVAVHPDMEVCEAVTILLKHRTSAMPVVNEGGKLVGILAERDCLEAFVNEEYYDSPTALVRDLMSSEVVTVGPDADIFQAAELFSHHKFHSLPVLSRQRLVGEISRRDVIRAILKMHQEAVGR
jgi:CBS domain-containing protein